MFLSDCQLSIVPLSWPEHCDNNLIGSCRELKHFICRQFARIGERGFVFSVSGIASQEPTKARLTISFLVKLCVASAMHRFFS